jgi:hypothetical protein
LPNQSQESNGIEGVTLEDDTGRRAEWTQEFREQEIECRDKKVVDE